MPIHMPYWQRRHKGWSLTPWCRHQAAQSRGRGSDSQHFKSLRRGVLRAFWDLKAENGVFFRTEVFLDSIFSFLLIFLSNAFSWLHEILQEGSSRGKVSYRVSFQINPCAERASACQARACTGAEGFIHSEESVVISA